MKELSSLFEKYKKTIKPPQASIEKEVIAVIAAVTGITLTADAVTYTTSIKTVSLRVPAIVKQEILLQSPALLAELKRKLGDQNTPQHIR